MITYFGYGSNMNARSLGAKGIEPRTSRVACLNGYRLVFNVKHWFPHEGGVANVVPAKGSQVWGVVHEIASHDLVALDAVESYGFGYDRIEVELTIEGEAKRALTYVGLPDYLDASCLPTQRYMNIIVAGAREVGLAADYVGRLQNQALFYPPEYPPYLPPFDSALSEFDLSALQRHPDLTGLWGHVFDMRDAPARLRHLKDLFGGKDMTLFIVRRHDTSTGKESYNDLWQGHISKSVLDYLNAYLHNFGAMFRHAGRLRYR